MAKDDRTSKELKQLEVMWAVGLFEGEGSITLKKSKGSRKKDGSYSGEYSSPRLSMSQTDEDVIRRFQKVIGGTVRGPYERENRKPIWYWQIASKKGAEGIAKLFYPNLGIRRRKRIQEVFSSTDFGEIFY